MIFFIHFPFFHPFQSLYFHFVFIFFFVPYQLIMLNEFGKWANKYFIGKESINRNKKYMLSHINSINKKSQYKFTINILRL